MSEYTFERGRTLVLGELETALSAIEPNSVDTLIDAVEAADQVFFVGVGRVLLSLEAMAKRWAHLGIRTHIVGEITEPAITEKDVLIVGSGSGSTLFPAAIAKKAHDIGAKVIHIGSSPVSPVGEVSSLMVRIPVRTKHYLADEIDSAQPMTSLFEQSLLLLGDIVAKMIIERRGLDMKALLRYLANLE